MSYNLVDDRFHAVTATADIMTSQVARRGRRALFVCARHGSHPPTVISTLEGLRPSDVLVVAMTRYPEGRLDQETYGFRGSEATRQELGAC